MISPGPVELEYPTLLPFPAPKLRAYSKESVVAEKFEAMVKLGMANSRMKDFYDLWVMARQFEFRGPVLSAAIKATFERRRTALPSSSPLALTAELGEASSKRTQRQAFLKKSGLNASESLNEVAKELDEFVMPWWKASRAAKRWATLGAREVLGNLRPELVRRALLPHRSCCMCRATGKNSPCQNRATMNGIETIWVNFERKADSPNCWKQ